MLVLSRKSGESIRVGDNIEITICHVAGNRVKLAIAAPREVSIQRSELSNSPSEDIRPLRSLHEVATLPLPIVVESR